MTHHVENEADAFFRQGDEGTYEGGPADLLPSGMFDAGAQNPASAPTAEQLERRERFKRLVAGIVVTLGAGAVLAVVLRAGGNQSGQPKPEAAVTTKPVPAFAPKEPPPEKLESIPRVPSVPADGPAVESADKASAQTFESVPVAGPSGGTESTEIPEKRPVEAVLLINTTASRPSPRQGSTKVRVPTQPQHSIARSAAQTDTRTPVTTPAPAAVHASPPTALFPD